MKLNRKWWPYLLLTGIAIIFFYKTIFLGLLPFPGDLLLSEYNPWRHASYDGYYPGAIPSKVQYFDVLRELYPWKHLVIDEIKQGRLPLWNPYNFSGSPLLANHQSAVMYPLNFLYGLLPFDAAWTALVVLQPIMGSVFFSLYAVIMGISPWGAILGAVAFNYGSFANVWMEFNTSWHTILWLPLILWTVEKMLQTAQRRYWHIALLSFAVFSSATAGHPQDFIYVLGFSIIYAISRIFIRPPIARQGVAVNKLVISLVLGFLGGLGLAAIQIIPTIELYLGSSRIPHDYQFILSNMLIPPWQLIKMFVPDFFGNPATKTYFLEDSYVSNALSIGLIGSMLAIAALITRSTSWPRKFFLGSACIVLLLTVRTPLTELLYRIPIPILSTGSPSRMLSLLAFSLAVLAGLGWDIVSHDSKYFFRTAGLTLVIIITAWIAALMFYPPTTVRAMILATAVFGSGTLAWYFMPQKLRAPAMTTILVIELVLSFLKFNPFVPHSFVYPPHPLWEYLRSQNPIDRFWGYGTAAIPSNISIMERLQSPDGIDPLNLKNYNQFIQMSHNGKLARTFTRSTRSDGFIAPGFGEKDLGQNQSRLRMLDALGVRFVIDQMDNASTAETFPPDHFQPVWKEDSFTIFENTKAAPRYFLTHDIIPYGSMEEFETIFSSPAFTAAQSVLISKNDHPPKLLPDESKEAKLISYTPTRVVIETKTQTPQLLYLSDSDDGNWKATVNGKDTQILRANWAFRGLLVPAGSTRVELNYLPASFLWGTGVSAMTFMLLLTAAGFALIKKAPRQRSARFRSPFPQPKS